MWPRRLAPFGALLLSMGALTCAPLAPRARVTETPPRVTGQWIWTRADAELFERTRAAHPELEASVLAATVVLGGNGLELRRGLSPAVGGADHPVAVVVRLDDSVHALWDARGPDGVATQLGPLLARVLADARATGTPIAELELDYDAPERRLAAWATVVATLAERELAGVPLWITSIPVHLEDPAYGARLAGHVKGHILQLFDTGLHCDPDEVENVRAELELQGLPFRLGVAAFERANRGRRTTEHACWLEHVSALRGVPGFAGAWVFPAGRDYATRLAALEATP